MLARTFREAQTIAAFIGGESVSDIAARQLSEPARAVLNIAQEWRALSAHGLVVLAAELGCTDEEMGVASMVDGWLHINVWCPEYFAEPRLHARAA